MGMARGGVQHCLIGIGLMFATLATASAGEPIRLRLTTDVGSGQTTGYLRIPKAGTIGTTSERRPQLKSLGVRQSNFIQFGVEVGWGDNNLSFSLDWVKMVGRNRIRHAFKTQDEQFYPGSKLASRIQLDLYRLNYGRTLTLSPQLSLRPKVGIVILDFGLRIADESGERVNRSFAQINVEIGLDLRWDMAENWALLFEYSYSPRYTAGAGHPSIHHGAVRLEWTFLRRGTTALKMRGGLSFDRWSFEDAQVVPNRISINRGPSLSLGLVAEF